MLKGLRFTIGNKVLASVLFVAIAFSSLSGYTFWKLNQIEQGYDALLFRSVPLVFDVKDMSTELRSQAYFANGYLLTGDRLYITEYQASKQKMQQLFGDLDKNLTTPEGKQKIAELKVSVAKYNEVTEKAIDIRTQKGINDSLVAMSEAGAINRETEQKMESFVAFLSDRMELRVKQNEEKQQEIEKVIVILDIIIIIFAVVIALWLARKISSPLNMVLKEANKIAGGDLTKANIKYNGNDEIGDMITAFDNMGTSLRELIKKTTAATAHVADSAVNLTEGAEQSAQASVQVAEAITQVSMGTDQQVMAVAGALGVVEEMSDSITKVVENATVVSETSQKASASATQGEQVIDQAVRQIVNAEQTVLDSANTITELGIRSQEIGQIVETISSIAGQTNLLALNAAIEAARAGEQGRGFAVVAEEVRKLAEQSQEAAKKIADMIASIQGDTNRAVQVMNKGKQEVQSGASLVQNAGSAFKDIREAVDVVSLQVNDIVLAIDKLSDGSRQIIGAVREIEVVSKENASQAQSVSAATEEQSASMEEISASSHALRQMADQLRAEVSKFKV